MPKYRIRAWLQKEIDEVIEAESIGEAHKIVLNAPVIVTRVDEVKDGSDS
jgi:hypothetical protein